MWEVQCSPCSTSTLWLALQLWPVAVSSSLASAGFGRVRGRNCGIRDICPVQRALVPLKELCWFCNECYKCWVSRLLCWGGWGSGGAALPCSRGDCHCWCHCHWVPVCLPQAAEPRAWPTATAPTPRPRCRSSWAPSSPSLTPQHVAGQLCSLLVFCCSQRLLQLLQWAVVRWFTGVHTRELCRKCLLISSCMPS